MEPVILGWYRSVPEAEVAKATLTAAGIDAELHDAAMVGIDWLYSDAVHGIKLSVLSEDRERALEILEHEPAAVPLPLHPEDDEADMRLTQPEPAALACPDCGSTDVRKLHRLRTVMVLLAIYGAAAVVVKETMLFGLMAGITVILFVLAPTHRCRDCSHSWSPMMPHGHDAPDEHSVAFDDSSDDSPPCPRCASTETADLDHRRLKAAILILPGAGIAAPFILPFLRKFRCVSCKHRWK